MCIQLREEADYQIWDFFKYPQHYGHTGYRVQSLGIIKFDITETVSAILWHLIHASNRIYQNRNEKHCLAGLILFWNTIKHIYFKYKICYL